MAPTSESRRSRRTCCDVRSVEIDPSATAIGRQETGDLTIVVCVATGAKRFGGMLDV